MKNKSVLSSTIRTAVSGLTPGPFAYAEAWSKSDETYEGLAIENSLNASVVIDRDSVIVRSDIAENHRATPKSEDDNGMKEGEDISDAGSQNRGYGTSPLAPESQDPTRFIGTVMVTPDRPAKEIHQIIEAIVEQLTTLPNAEVSIKLEIDAEVPQGLDRNKVRVLMENAATLGFIDKVVK